MTNSLRVMIESGKRGKRAVAVAPDWPGLSRGDKTEEGAVARLLAYVPRYARVAQLAGMADDFSALDGAEVIGRYLGSGSTDFWGISFGFSEIDQAPMSSGQLERELALLQGSWAFFDEVRARVSPEMARGPRGGGKDREQIVRRTVLNEQDWAKKLGLPGAGSETPDDAGLRAP